ncbi:MAG: zinc ABC transporter ATP-binding protein ZnuC [Gammaproteobacteria bacterium]|nr:zinc ABC transporter ATP-binding protein ZnuC [Gammaproteobacteria bacterium]MBL6998830.1 zinc ABC transporter ATP-binding protein ZnuC [Gammaproteobacteria bacterium]
MPLIHASHIGYQVAGRQILHDISFVLEPDQITTIIGPNGAGKSSLVNIVIGLNRAFSGRITRQAGLTMSYLPQNSKMNPLVPMTVRRLMSLTQKVSEKDLLQALTKTSVAALVNQQVRDLSGGEMQRVMLARALLGRPQLLVLDEPTAGVDITGEVEMYELIAELRDEIHCAILMVSHDLHLVMSKTDQVLCLNHHLCCSGKPESVSQHPEYLALFGGRVAESLAVYTHHHDHVHELSGGCESCVQHPEPPHA